MQNTPTIVVVDTRVNSRHNNKMQISIYGDVPTSMELVSFTFHDLRPDAYMYIEIENEPLIQLYAKLGDYPQTCMNVRQHANNDNLYIHCGRIDGDKKVVNIDITICDIEFRTNGIIRPIQIADVGNWTAIFKMHSY